jgi:hypothetical protein
MKKSDILQMERILSRSVGLELSLNELRIIVSSLNAVAYWAQVEEKAYMDADGWLLKERLEGLYRDELDDPFAAGVEEASLCIGF